MGEHNYLLLFGGGMVAAGVFDGQYARAAGYATGILFVYLFLTLWEAWMRQRNHG